jgi:Secretion system C-terminal sorting domain
VVFLDQAPNGVNGLFADSDCQLCGTLQQSIAENVNVTTAGPNVVVTELVIWGGYYPENIPNTTDDFTIILHADNAGQPGAVLFSASGLEATSRVSTGVVLFGVNEYMFTFDFSATPIPVVAAGTYWLEIFNNSVQSGNFFWETGNPDATHGIVGSVWTTTTPGVTWNIDTATDLSLQINGDDNVPVEFTSFTANANFGVVDLQWITATETNNQGFEVQRSTGNEFETIAFVQGQGTTTESQVYTYSDNSVQVGSYTYRLKQLDFDGTTNYSNEIEVNVPAPAVFTLDQNYPNPFNPSTQIAFRLAVDSKVSLKVFNVLGQEVATLVNSNLVAGGHSINFDASALNSGVYLYRIEAAGIDGSNFVDIKKMILTK